MIKRVPVAAMLLLPLGVLADDPGKGEDIFDPYPMRRSNTRTGLFSHHAAAAAGTRPGGQSNMLESRSHM